MPHSPFGQRLTDKAWGTNNLHLREAHPSPTEGPACSNAGCDCVRGGRMASLLFERIRPVCCLGRRKGPRSSQRSRTHRGRCEARGHPVTQRQHPESREARLGIRDHTQSLRRWDSSRGPATLEHPTLAGQEARSERLPRHRQRSGHHPPGSPEPAHSPKPLTCSRELIHVPRP